MVSTTILISRSNNDDSANQASSSAYPSYGTRTRKNIRPSARLRQSPESNTPHRKLKLFSRARPGSLPQTSNFPSFPPPNVMLHSEDANNKVLMAIGRSFLSVDNRAMTIKDLAEMCMNFGLFCQSASAAGQAITSFIRSHMQRCEIEQDQPLLLKHVLSGTPCDDDLVSALHSRSGGAHCTLANAESRLTNFRRGTTIWYLSKAAGAPCPFARAGIRLCDYKEGGDVKEEQQCGQKRKRFLRARSKGRGGSDSEDIISDAETRPPKVTLTLRLKPPRVLAVMSTPSPTSGSGSYTSSSGQRSASIIDLSKDSDADEDSMSVDESEDDDLQSARKQEESIFPPYPRQSISIPVYTPSIEDLYPDLFTPAKYSPPGRRSPSVPRSIASPPPDSDEDDDVPNSFRTRRRHSSARLRSSLSKNDIDRDFGEGEDEFEVGTRYESPGPRSPWTPFAEDGGVIIKEEPNDVGGILEAWEHIDNASSSNLAAFLDHSSFDSEPGVKSEEYSFWNWNGFDRSESEANSNTTDTVIIKEEDVDNAIILSAKGVADDGSSMLGPLSAVEPSYHADYRLLTDIRRHSEVLWKDAELLGPDSVRLQDFEEGHWPRICPTRIRAHTSPSLFAPVIGSTSDTKDSYSPQREPSESITSTDRNVMEPSMEKPDPTVVHTIRHVSPAICVAQVDGVSIYQLIVDSHPLLRRFDTDFVNLSRIAEYLGQPRSSLESVPVSKDVVEGCPLIRGKWVPLERARSFVHDFLTIHSVLDIFLSEKLFDQFSPCVQALHRSHHHLRSCNQFGPPFRSMVEDSRSLMSIDDLFEANASWERDDDHLISVHPSLGTKSMDIPVPALQEESSVADLPLSPTEQEIFHSFCGSPEWDSPIPVITDIVTESGKENEDVRPTEERCLRGVRARTLRRSKRVADAMASRSRTRPGKTRVTLP